MHTSGRLESSRWCW